MMGTSSNFALDQTFSTYDLQGNITKGFNDIYLNSSGDLATVSGVDDLEQTINNALWLWIKEYEFNTELGISYAGVFNNDDSNIGIFTQQIENAVLQCNDYLTTDQLKNYGIRKINAINYSLDKDNRNLNIDLNIALNNGTNLNIQTGSR